MDVFTVLFIVLLIGLIWYGAKKQENLTGKKPVADFPTSWRLALIEHVTFYNALNQEEKKHFEFKVQEFLEHCRITGVKTKVEITDKLLVASSAVIPIFNFKDWTYTNISEVLLYPAVFNKQFETNGSGTRILGMVGNGYLEGKMILSKPALRHGFKNESDKKNTAIHEFVHLIDKTDGVIDGIPTLLLEKQYVIPWLDLMNQKIEEIFEKKSDINPYGGANRAEFFSVASEYFFERPKLLERKHPQLYKLLEQVFNRDMADMDLSSEKQSIGRNSPCVCGSGKKFKKCCGKDHF